MISCDFFNLNIPGPMDYFYLFLAFYCWIILSFNREKARENRIYSPTTGFLRMYHHIYLTFSGKTLVLWCLKWKTRNNRNNSTRTTPWILTKWQTPHYVLDVSYLSLTINWGDKFYCLHFTDQITAVQRVCPAPLSKWSGCDSHPVFSGSKAHVLNSRCPKDQV